MPPRPRGTLGYRGIHVRPSDTFYAEIHFDDMCLGLGTFDTADNATRAYNAAAWCLNRPRREMNFPDVMTREWAQYLEPPPTGCHRRGPSLEPEAGAPPRHG
ncbi:hypothetical protein D1007_36083 [Hordeum vulgare]|nr:hypothetical protein D1007_36083 [Hordeum vulgare]